MVDAEMECCCLLDRGSGQPLHRLVLQYGTIRYSDVSLLKYSFEFFAPFSRLLRNHTCIYAARPPRDLLTALPLPHLLLIRE